ncbi:MAG: TIGR01212 family radical SAM protein [Anaerolineae bacterium]
MGIPDLFGEKRYRPFSRYLREIFGCRVQKIPLDAGFTCPNRDGRVGFEGCIYCGPRGSGTGAYENGVPLGEQIRAGIESGKRRFGKCKFIAYFQAFTNTYAPPERLKSLYDEALRHQEVVGLSIGTRPDCAPDEVLEVLEDYARRCHFWVEYGLQSAHDYTLELINRGHDIARFVDAVERTKGRGINICAHIILGLPGETKEEMMTTADLVASLKLEGLKIHSLYVLKGTKLAEIHQRGEFRLLELEEYVSLVCDFLERLPPDMVIQRLTGEAPRDLLVAPRWSREKMAVLGKIDTELEQRGSYQGIEWRPSPIQERTKCLDQKTI